MQHWTTHVVILLLYASVLCGCVQTPKHGECSDPVVPPTRSASDLITATLGPKAILPVWTERHAVHQIELASADMESHYREVLNRALSKYPEALVLDNVDAIYLVALLDVNGRGAKGYSANRTIFVTLLTADREWMPDAQVEYTFHHEMSSILLSAYPTLLDKAAWVRANPDGFRYGGWKFGDDPSLSTDAMRRDGFLIAYCQSHAINDFNCIAGSLFTCSDDIWQCASKYPRISAKLDVTIEFYRAIDPSFTKERFLSYCEKPSR